MRKIFYTHWIFCISFLSYISYYEPKGIATEKIICGFGSAFLLGIAISTNAYFNDSRSTKIHSLYFQANLVSFYARALFEMALFVYGESLSDKWIVICIFSLIVVSYMAVDWFVKKPMKIDTEIQYN